MYPIPFRPLIKVEEPKSIRLKDRGHTVSRKNHSSYLEIKRYLKTGNAASATLASTSHFKIRSLSGTSKNGRGSTFIESKIIKKMTRRVTKIGSCYRGRLQIQTRIRLIGSPLYLEFMKAGVKAHSDTILCTFLLFSADMIYITVVNTIVLQAAD